VVQVELKVRSMVFGTQIGALLSVYGRSQVWLRQQVDGLCGAEVKRATECPS